MDLKELEVKIAASRAKLKALPKDDRKCGKVLYDLSRLIRSQYQQTGDQHCLQEMTSLAKSAVDATPCGQRDLLSKRLCYLGVVFKDQHLRDHSLEAINHCITSIKRSLDLTPDGHQFKASRLSELGSALGWRYQRTNRIIDIRTAIDQFRSALDTTPDNSPKRATRLASLGVAFRDLYLSTRSSDDLEEAIASLQESVKLPSSERIKYTSWRIMTLASLIGDRFQLTGSVDDLDESIRLSEEAINLTPENSPNLAERLDNLGIGIQDRYLRTNKKETQYLEKALVRFEQALNHANSGLTYRLRAGTRAIDATIELQQWDQALVFLEKTLELLPKVVPRSNSYDDFQFILRQYSGLGSVAASVSLRAGKTVLAALQFAERGRGIISNLKMSLQSDELALKEQDESLWSKYLALRDALTSTSNPIVIPDAATDSSANDSMTRALSIKQRSYDLDEIENEIRRKPGFEKFQLAPDQFELHELACDGPVVYFNVNSLGRHAFLITRDNLRVLPLPGLSLHDLQEHVPRKGTGNKLRRNPKVISISGDIKQTKTHSMSESMLWLWKVAVKPVLGELGLLRPDESCGRLPSVWWVCGGLLALLPIHAAGDHSPGSKENTISCVESSYSPSLKSLRYSRMKSWTPIKVRNDFSPNMQESKVLVVSMPQTPGHCNLNVDDEIAAIQTHIGAGVEVEMLQSPSPCDTLEALKTSQMAHFACHGSVNTNEPSRSAILLGNGQVEELTVAEIQKVTHKAAQIAYLSVCSAADSGAAPLIEENVHLANTFQVAGFRHVIGTLWGVYDSSAAEVAAKFYQHLAEGDGGPQSVSHALHDALVKYRSTDDNWRYVEKWGPFIHIGP